MPSGALAEGAARRTPRPYASQREREGSEGRCPAVPTSGSPGPRSLLFPSVLGCLHPSVPAEVEQLGWLRPLCLRHAAEQRARPPCQVGTTHYSVHPTLTAALSRVDLRSCQAAVRETADKHRVCTLDASVLGEAAQKPNPFIQTKCLEKSPFSPFWASIPSTADTASASFRSSWKPFRQHESRMTNAASSGPPGVWQTRPNECFYHLLCVQVQPVPVAWPCVELGPRARSRSYWLAVGPAGA